MSKVQIVTRIDKDLLDQIKQIEDETQADRAEVIRRLLKDGTTQYRLGKAVTLLRDGKVTVSRAAEIAGVSVWDIVEIMRVKKVAIPYTAEDLRRSLELVR